MRLATFFLALLMFVAGPAAAADGVVLQGHAAQGGLLIGKASPGSAVRVDGRSVRVSKDGHFLIGFGRDAAAPVRLRVVEADGTVSERTIGVEKRDFPVQRIDGLPPRQVTPDPELIKRIQAENTLIKTVWKKDSKAAGFLSGFVRPVSGRISGVFGSQRILNGKPRSPHSGLDIAAPKGTPVAAMADGTVVLVHPDMFYTGKTVMIDHGHGLASVYAHMSAISVREGESVTGGQTIGAVGATGRATGPHLHWGVSLFDTKLDPALVVPEGAGKS